MKITPSGLSIPPYISTSWKNIISLHVEMQLLATPILVVCLTNDQTIAIPNLDGAAIEAIFSAHNKYLEMEQKLLQNSLPPQKPTAHPFEGGLLTPFEAPADLQFNLDSMGTTVFQHDPNKANTPDLPEGILSKIKMLSKTMGLSDPNMIPEPEPHCNCHHCQVARALLAGMEEESSLPDSPAAGEEEEIVSDEELSFRTWEINQTSDKLFTVQNPIDSKEHYSVYLGDPVGCTCGQKHCEHVHAVLNS